MIELSSATPAIKIEEFNNPDVDVDRLLSRLTLGGTSSNGNTKLTAQTIADQKIADFDSFVIRSIDAEFLRSDPTETYHMLCRVFEELQRYWDKLNDTNDENVKNFFSNIISAVSKLMSDSLAQSWESGNSDLTLPLGQTPLSPRFFGQMLLNSPLNTAFCFTPINPTSAGKTPLFASMDASMDSKNGALGAPKEPSPKKRAPVSFSPAELASIGLSPIGAPVVGFSPICFSPIGNPLVGFSPICSSPTSSQLNRSPKPRKSEDPERENKCSDKNVRPRDLDLVPRSPATLRRRAMDNPRGPPSPLRLDNLMMNDFPSPIYPYIVIPRPSLPFIPLSPLKLNEQSQQPFRLLSPKKQQKQERSNLSTEIVNDEPEKKKVSTDEPSKDEPMDEASSCENTQPKTFRPKTPPRKSIPRKRGRQKRFRPDIAKLKESHAHLFSDEKQFEEKKKNLKETSCKAGKDKKSLASSAVNLKKYDDPQMNGGTLRVAEKHFCPIDEMPEEYLSNSRSNRQGGHLKRLGFSESSCGIAKHTSFRLRGGMHYFGIIYPNGELHCRTKNECCKAQVPSSVMAQLNKDNLMNPRIYRILMFNPSKSCKYSLDGLKICPVNNSISVIIGNDYGRYSCVISYAQSSGRRKPIFSEDYIWDVVMRNMWSWISIQMHDMLELIDFHIIQKGEKWSCNICGESFGASLQCMRHAPKHVDTNILTCEFCRQDFSRVDALQRHAAMCRCLWK